MIIEIDQSGKIEETHHDTVLAFSNGKHYSVRIKAKTKREIQKLIRSIGSSRVFVIHTFSVAIYLLIKDHLNEISQIIIDPEYPGKEKWIEKILENIFIEHKVKNYPQITFKSIGRKSMAHHRAIAIFHGKVKADKILDIDSLSKELIKYKKQTPVLKHIVRT